MALAVGVTELLLSADSSARTHGCVQVARTHLSSREKTAAHSISELWDENRSQGGQRETLGDDDDSDGGLLGALRAGADYPGSRNRRSRVVPSQEHWDVCLSKE